MKNYKIKTFLYSILCIMLIAGLLFSCNRNSKTSESEIDINDIAKTNDKNSAETGIPGYKLYDMGAEAKKVFSIGDPGNEYLIQLKVTGTPDISSDWSGATAELSYKNTDGTVIETKSSAVNTTTHGGKTVYGVSAKTMTTVFSALPGSFVIEAVINKNGNMLSKITRTVTKAAAADIYSWRDLDLVKNNLSVSYTMKDDVFFPADNTFGYGVSFMPIGDDSNKFSGNFDGNGKTISNLKIDRGSNPHAGLFGYVEGLINVKAEIKNLTIDHSGIKAGKYVGALAGKVTYTNINNVVMKSTAAAKIEGNDEYTGGLVGHGTAITITGYATGEVNGNRYAGGLIGFIDAGSLTGYTTGAVSAGFMTGGLAGYGNNSSVTGYSTGEISGSINYAGGLVGSVYNSSTVTGYATGTVNSTSGIVGGLAGNVSSSSTVKGYATGAIIGSENAGGLAGSLFDNSSVIGYARNQVTRNSGTEIKFGLLGGHLASGATVKGYNSATESTLKNSDGSTLTGDASSDSGKPITMGVGIERDNFDAANTTTPGDFVFGKGTGNWTWVKNGQWPAINLPAAVGGNYTDASQPTK